MRTDEPRIRLSRTREALDRRVDLAQQQARLDASLAYVDSYVGSERKLRADDGDRPMTRPVCPPQRRAKIREGALLGRVDPELARDIEPLQGPVVQRQKGQQPLDAEGKEDRLAVAEELEAVDQAKVELSRGSGARVVEPLGGRLPQ